MTKHRRNFAALAAALSAQLVFAVGSNIAAISTAGAVSVGVNGDIVLASPTYTVAQSGGSVTLTAQRLGGTSGALSVTYAASSGTAVAGKDFTGATGTVTWANGDRANKTFKIPLMNQAAYAGTKWFTVQIKAGANTILGAGVASKIYINGTNSSLYPGVVSLNLGSYSVAEAAGSVTLVVSRSGGTKGSASVVYKTANGTAVSPTQFTSVYGTLTWANGDGSDKTIKIALAKNPFSGTKSFAVQLAAGAGTSLGAHGSATVSITGTGTASTTPTPPTAPKPPAAPPVITKSIKQWVSCDETIDETAQVAQALMLAANHAFTLIVDCPVRLHVNATSTSSINVPDGVTVQFQGAGEFMGVHSGPPALAIAHPSTVSFINWTYTYL